MNHNQGIGRFTGVDPLASDMPSWSPYNYVFNNPVRLIDPLGLSPEDTTDPPCDDCTYSGGTLPTITVSAKRTRNNYDQSPVRYGFNGTFEQWQQTYGFEGMSYDNASNYWNQAYGADFDNYVAAQDKAEAAKVAVEKMTFWMVEVFPAVTTVLAPSGGVGNGGVTQPGLNIRSFKFSSPIADKVGRQTVDDFISTHAYNRHKFNPSRVSSRSRTQYGKGIDVDDIRNQTITDADDIVKHYDDNGVHYATTYKKTFNNQNISTNATPTGESRVIINHLDDSKSTQFPYYKKGVTDGF